MGEIIGGYTGVNNRGYCYLRLANGSFKSFNIKGAAGTKPTGINDKGLITSFYLDKHQVTRHARLPAAAVNFAR